MKSEQKKMDMSYKLLQEFLNTASATVAAFHEDDGDNALLTSNKFFSYYINMEC